MATLTADDEYRARLIATLQANNAYSAIAHFCECWEMDGPNGLLKVRLREGVEMGWFKDNFVPVGISVEDLNCKCWRADGHV